MARMCASVNVPWSGDPRCPLVPKLTNWLGSCRSGWRSKNSFSRRATSISISFGAGLPASGEIAIASGALAVGRVSRVRDIGRILTLCNQDCAPAPFCRSPAQQLIGRNFSGLRLCLQLRAQSLFVVCELCFYFLGRFAFPDDLITVPAQEIIDGLDANLD